jgi:hypothetical protein
MPWLCRAAATSAEFPPPSSTPWGALGVLRQHLLRVPPQQLVEVFVASHNGKRRKRRRRGDRIAIGTKFDIAAEECSEFRRRPVSEMFHLQPRRCQTGVRNLAADANQRHQPELDLVPFGMAIDVDVVKRNRRRLILQAETQANAFNHDLAVSLGVSKCIRKLLRRRCHIVNQTDLAEIEAARQVEAQQFVLQLLGG